MFLNIRCHTIHSVFLQAFLFGQADHLVLGRNQRQQGYAVRLTPSFEFANLRAVRVLFSPFKELLGWAFGTVGL